VNNGTRRDDPAVVLRWNSAGDPEGSLLLAQWQGGKLQIVAPKSAATTSHVVTVKPAWAS